MMRFGMLAGGAATMAVVIACYSVSLKVSGERKAVEDLKVQIAGDLRGIRTLEAEFRTRARQSELQRWNDEVLGLQAASTLQFVRDPVQLAAFEVTPKPAQTPRYAVAEAPAKALPPVTTVAYRPDADPAPVVIAAAEALAAPAQGQASLQRVSMR